MHEEAIRKADVLIEALGYIRQFHGVVLGSGSLPLSILEKQVDTWVAARRGAVSR